MTWQPIETAPRDGTVILLHNKGEVFAGWFSRQKSGYCWWFLDTPELIEDDALEAEVIVPNAWTDEDRYRPTHWMPLPAPPGV